MIWDRMPSLSMSCRRYFGAVGRQIPGSGCSGTPVFWNTTLRPSPPREPAGPHGEPSRIQQAPFGVLATFVTSADVSDDVVYNVVKAVFDDFDRFKGLHPAFEILEPEAMVSQGLSVPLHPGAERYYREKGWLPAS